MNLVNCSLVKKICLKKFLLGLTTDPQLPWVSRHQGCWVTIRGDGVVWCGVVWCGGGRGGGGKTRPSLYDECGSLPLQARHVQRTVGLVHASSHFPGPVRSTQGPVRESNRGTKARVGGSSKGLPPTPAEAAALDAPMCTRNLLPHTSNAGQNAQS